ncbi:hypothetical protein ACFSUP_04245 [Gracilibacillus thailandensis]|uniref:hypothetical protein n=1 Tax=Gracilibacillus thailandensis TaxID=563735 RepID=UPI003640FE09
MPAQTSLVSPALMVWMLIGAIGGLILVIAVPWVSARLAGGQWPQRVGRFYMDLAMTCLRRAALVARKNGGVALVPTKHDGKKEADKYTLGGETGHVSDEFGVVGRLEGNRFGMALEKRTSYVSPLLSRISSRFQREREEGNLGEFTASFQKKEGDEIVQETEEAQRAGATMSTTTTLTRLHDAWRGTSGSSDRRDGEVAKTYTEYSQELFHERMSFGQTMVVLLACALGFCLVFFGMRYGGGQTSARTISETSLMLLATGAGAKGWLKEHVDDILAGLVPAIFLLGVPLLGWYSQGLGIGIIALLVMIGVAVTIPVAIKLGPGMPGFGFIGPAFGQIFVVLAQLATWRGLILRRDDGSYRYCALHEADDVPEIQEDYYAIDDGDVIPVEGTPGDLAYLGWRPIGVAEEVSERNIGRFKADLETAGATDGGGFVRTNKSFQGYQEYLPVPREGEVTLRARTVYQWCRGTSETGLIEQGIQQGLEEAGGRQQIGTVATSIASLFALVIGGAMAYVVMGGV